MDKNFDVTLWRPTRPLHPGCRRPSIERITVLSDRLRKQTESILRHPYDPGLWHCRASTLADMHYPELALGDAHKAKLLCRNHLERLRKPRRWRLGFRMGFWMYEDGASEQETECKDVLMDNLRRMERRASDLERACTEYSYEGIGRFHPRPYPWMEPDHGKRSDKLLKLINRELAADTVDKETGSPSCSVKRRAFGRGNDHDTSDVWGVFASRHLKRGDVVLVDKTRAWGCNGPGQQGDNWNLGGGKGCSDPIHPNLDSEDTSLDMRWIRDDAGKHASSVLRNCRLLLCCVNDGVEHPLDHHLIARMTPTYPRDRISSFFHTEDVAIPNQALQQFGVDIFANHKFDTWVLFTIDARAHNNSCGTPIMESVQPLFSLFNHSCEPNVDWTTSKNHQTVELKALRDISNGEQLFVEYDGYIHEMPLESRRKAMWRWLDGPCQCTRCVREEKLHQQAGGGSNYSGPERSDWDTDEKPTFPEDALQLRN